MSLVGNPYDGYALANALEQVKEVTQIKPAYAYCDQGYRGHGIEGATTITICGKISKQASRATRKWIKRRASIEPIIGHLKSDNRLSRNYLKGEQGNAANVVLAAAGYNLAKLLAWFYCAWRKFVANV